MTPPDEERELNELLARRSPLSHDYASIGTEEPPASVDRMILAAAERAARLPERPIAQSRSRWMIPLALAATVLVSFSMLYELGKNPAPVVERMANKMRSAPPPVEVTLEPPAPAPAALAETARQAAKADSKSRLGNVADQPRPAAVLAMERQGLNAARAPPPASIVAETAVTVAPVDTLERHASASPALTEADLEHAIAFLRAPTAGGLGAFASPKGQEAAHGMLDKRVTETNARLQDLQRLYEAGDKAAALAALVEFRQNFPQHPLSQLLNRPQP